MAGTPVVLQPGLCLVRPQYTPNPDTADKPENVLWFVSANTQTPTLSNLQGMAAAFDSGWAAVVAPVLASTHSYLGSIWTDYSTAFGLTYSSVGTFAPSTGAQGAPLPSQVAALISLHIQERYKGGHGRIYLPWIGVSAQSTSDSNNMTTAANNALTTNYGALNGHTSGSGVLGGQSQRVYRQKTKAGEAHLMQISSFTVQNTFATQRRRIRRAAHH